MCSPSPAGHCLRVARRDSQLLLLPTCWRVASQRQWLQEALGKEWPSPAAMSQPECSETAGAKGWGTRSICFSRKKGPGLVSSERLSPASAITHPLPPAVGLCGQGTFIATLSASGAPTQVSNTKSYLLSAVTVPGGGRREHGRPQGPRGRGGEKRRGQRGWSPLLQA